MQYTFKNAYEALDSPDKKSLRLAIKQILAIKSNMQFYRVMNGETPLRADKIEAVENEFKKFGIKKIWD